MNYLGYTKPNCKSVKGQLGIIMYEHTSYSSKLKFDSSLTHQFGNWIHEPGNSFFYEIVGEKCVIRVRMLVASPIKVHVLCFIKWFVLGFIIA